MPHPPRFCPNALKKLPRCAAVRERERVLEPKIKRPFTGKGKQAFTSAIALLSKVGNVTAPVDLPPISAALVAYKFSTTSRWENGV